MKNIMTVRVSKHNKKTLFIIASVITVLLGISAFVLAYGIRDGWDAVARWFSSDYAILLYIFLGLYASVILTLVIGDLIKKL